MAYLPKLEEKVETPEIKEDSKIEQIHFDIGASAQSVLEEVLLKMVNHVFGNRYIPTIIADERHLINVIRYIYQNPVRAGIVDNINNYPYSCLGQYLGIENIGLKIIPDSYTRSMFQYGIDGYMEWLSHINANLNIVDTGNVKQSLSRSIYRYSRRQRDTIFKNETSIVI